ncbi:hypothetical protein C4D60_Mb05t13400 [Musa balbisiana]|uniref:Uncharacterized protein n=1 Tax=Musa balbisiana TaxID=52838 RepID=A0A4S8JVW5_MUSBA|nr:hypothetical protein C4D60_Mb05t13400 [Musa balbisiana]
MAAGSAERLLSCIPASNSHIEQRPYHRDCKCALHHLKDRSKACPCSSSMISFLVRRSWRRHGISSAASFAHSTPLQAARGFSRGRTEEEDGFHVKQ